MIRSCLAAIAGTALALVVAAPAAVEAVATDYDPTGCWSEGVLSVGVEATPGDDYLSHEIDAHGSFVPTTERADALRVGLTYPERWSAGEIVILDDRVALPVPQPQLALAAIFPPGSDGVLTAGTAEYVVLGASGSPSREPRIAGTSAPQSAALAATEAFWFDLNLGPFLDLAGGDGSASRQYDAYLTAGRTLVYAADRAAYEAANGPLSVAHLRFENADFGVRCPGASVVADIAPDGEPAIDGEPVEVRISAWAVPDARLEGEVQLWVCGPTIAAESCLPAGHELATAAIAGTNPVVDLSFIPDGAGTYCVAVAYVSPSMIDGAFANPADACIDVSVAGAPRPTPSPTTAPPSAPLVSPTSSASGIVGPALVGGGVVLVGATAATVLLVRARRRPPAASSPADEPMGAAGLP